MRPEQSSMPKTECFRQIMQSYLKDWKTKNRSIDKDQEDRRVEFLTGIWDQPVRLNNKVQWLKKVEAQRLRGAKKQENITITNKKTATKSEELEGSWIRWTARILD